MAGPRFFLILPAFLLAGPRFFDFGQRERERERETYA